MAKTKAKKEKSYFREVADELSKVKWATKAEMLKFCIAVIVFIIIFGIYFYGLDILFAWIKGTVS
jgi:preprotein translocase SecE subunit